jgi:hypothetical protein
MRSVRHMYSEAESCCRPARWESRRPRRRCLQLRSCKRRRSARQHRRSRGSCSASRRRNKSSRPRCNRERTKPSYSNMPRSSRRSRDARRCRRSSNRGEDRISAGPSRARRSSKARRSATRLRYIQAGSERKRDPRRDDSTSRSDRDRSPRVAPRLLPAQTCPDA